MRYLDLRLSMPDEMLHPMQAFIREGDAVEYEVLRSWNGQPERDIEYELFYVVGDREPYREAVESVDRVQEYTIAPVDDQSFHVWVRQETWGGLQRMREAFLGLGLIVVPPIFVDDEAAMYLTIVGEGETLQRLVDSVPDEIDATVQEIGDYDRWRGTLTAGLTDRQYEAVATAVELGYYRTPQETSVEAVGDALDCSASTASVLLSKAEQSVMERVVDGPGRP